MATSARLGARLAPLRTNLSSSIARRGYASTTEATANAASEAATKAKSTAQNVAGKASEGLSRVSSSAGPAIRGAASSVGSTLSSIGGPIGRTVTWVETKVPSAVYYSRVAIELGRIVARGQSMSPPSVSTMQSYYQSAIRTLQNPASLLSSASSTVSSANPNKLLSQVRNVNGQQLAFAGVVFAEVLGFFTVGEMIGRFKVVGYRGDTGHH